MEQNGNISAHYALRLADLRSWHRVTAACPDCGRKSRLDATSLGRGLPLHTRLSDLEQRLVCTSCGNRQANRLLVAMASRD
jgi:C4-type Zn-finger protein